MQKESTSRDGARVSTARAVGHALLLLAVVLGACSTPTIYKRGRYGEGVVIDSGRMLIAEEAPLPREQKELRTKLEGIEYRIRQHQKEIRRLDLEAEIVRERMEEIEDAE